MLDLFLPFIIGLALGIEPAPATDTELSETVENTVQPVAWRCGLWDIRYGVNGAPAETGIAMEPCNDEFAQPNVMLDVENFPPYVTYPLNSVESITVEVVFDDGTVESMQFDRNDVRIP